MRMYNPVFATKTMFVYDEIHRFVLPIIQKCGNSSIIEACVAAGITFADGAHCALGLDSLDPIPYKHKFVPVRDPVSRFQAFRTMRPQEYCQGFYAIEEGDIDEDGLVNEHALCDFVRGELQKNPHTECVAAHILPQARFWDDLAPYRDQFLFFDLANLNEVFSLIGLPPIHAMASSLPERPLSASTLAFIADTYAEDMAMWQRVQELA